MPGTSRRSLLQVLCLQQPAPGRRRCPGRPAKAVQPEAAKAASASSPLHAPVHAQAVRRYAMPGLIMRSSAMPWCAGLL